MKVKIQNKILNLLNIYAPNSPSSRIKFFDTISSFTLNYPGNYILSGDFNMVEDISRDRWGSTPTHKHLAGSGQLTELKTITDSVDVWPHCFPKSLGHTWFSSDQKISSRLDRFYVNKNLLCKETCIKVIQNTFSDHLIVSLYLKLHDEDRGPGYLKLNTSCLDDAFLIEELDSFWTFWKSKKPQDNNHLNQWWDLGTVYVKNTLIDYTQRKGKSKRARIKSVLSKLEQERKKENPNSDSNNDYKKEL